MDTRLLQQFRHQLATWIEARLDSQRLPFQRLEICPEIHTAMGRLVPDLVLWINRDSQLAGSIILLPDTVDSQVLVNGAAIASALGLGHFSTWAARDVSVWELKSGQIELRQNFHLPPANQVTPDDFQQVLNTLLEMLKVVTVTSAPQPSDLPAHYFANLCLRNLQELAPGLITSARLSAGQTVADDWLERAPREKAWLSLWRILYLLYNDRLPPGLQPERLELAIRYALADIPDSLPEWLCIQENEPPLPDGDAVRLHHLAGRLKQLGWPLGSRHAEELFCLLLNEAGRDFGLETVQLPWQTSQNSYWVNCQPPISEGICCLVAPRAYLAGWVLKSSMREYGGAEVHAERVQDLDTTLDKDGTVAILRNGIPLDRPERNARKILLRQVWPNRRFDLPNGTPAWAWDAIHLAGLTSADLSLCLPQGWHIAPGLANLWSILAERYQIADLAVCSTGEQRLHFVRKTKSLSEVLVHRDGRIIKAPSRLISGQPPGALQIWLKTNGDILDLICSKSMCMPNMLSNDGTDALIRGQYLFLHTRLGRYLWNLASNQTVLPELDSVAGDILTAGVPVPNEIMLNELSLVGSAEGRAIPEQEVLEQEFNNIFGLIPDLPAITEQLVMPPPRISRRSASESARIAAKVFMDGLPRFPEHYLMNVYRPALEEYDLRGPLQIDEVFFDRVILRGAVENQHLEVSGMVKAEALVLASYSSSPKVSIPKDDSLLTEIVTRYRADLLKLWDKLIRECRRSEPARQSALKLAVKIWQQKGFPPVNVLREE